MFYETADNRHGLPHDPFKGCVVPRPIGWISTVSGDGIVNLAPFSYFNAIASDPPMVMFSANGPKPPRQKDTVTNCEETGEFVANIATWDLREGMNRTSASLAPEVDEMADAGLVPEPARLVRPPRVAASPIHLECRYDRTVDLPGPPGWRNAMVIGLVIGVHIRDEVLTDGLVDMAKIRPIARLGYKDYSRVDMVFAMERPAD